MSRVLCALSGGVDSSVAALLLRQQGHDVVGVFMRNGVDAGSEGSARSCCSASDARDAARVADALGIPFYAVDYAEEFRGLIARFRAEYRAGRTPSPCVLCNQDLKFGHLFGLADAVGAERVATGHYARYADGELRRARDRAKDQSYFLFGIERALLPRLSFPLGERTKEEVRELATHAGLVTAEKPESMEVCFVPSGDYRDLLREEAPLTPGRFVSVDGADLGGHDGFEAFTVGQRRGLPARGRPQYVVELRPERAEVVIGDRHELLVRRFQLTGLRWLVPEPRPGERRRSEVQIRAHHVAAPATVETLADGRGAVCFDSAQSAVTPGQAAVFYDGDRVLGGGWVESVSAPV